MKLSIQQKALAINLEKSFYGSFAEIGAGQEVARHFFQAGAASGTIAKSMSAYDMIFSDSIYGREDSGRYVCEPRLMKMLEKEFSLLESRLEHRSENTKFFAFANTVATTGSRSEKSGHGWIGLRYQSKVNGPYNDIIVHLKLFDKGAKLQGEAVSNVGVNLIYGALFNHKPEDIIDQLFNEVSSNRLEADYIRFHGPDLENVDNRIMNLKLVEKGLAKAVLFTPQGEVLIIGDELFQHSVLVQRGSFAPVTNIHWDLQKSGIAAFKKECPDKADKLQVFMELTLQNLKDEGKLDINEFLDRMEAIAQLDQPVLVSNFNYFYELRQHLMQYTSEPIRMVLGGSLLRKLFERRHYDKLSSGILGGMGLLFKGDSKLYVYPQLCDGQILDSKSYLPEDDLVHLYKYIQSRDKLVDIVGCDLTQTEIAAEDILQMIKSNNSEWESYVPTEVVKVIKERKLFGFR